MPMQRGSEVGRRKAFARAVTRVGTSISLACVVGITGGCGLTPPLEDIVDRRLDYEEANLTQAALDERVAEIDDYYAEPRTATKVQASYETSLISISHVNGYEALWRGARACAWIALNKDVAVSRRMTYAEKGVLVGREAVEKLSARVESHYWYAHCLAALAELRGRPDSGLVRKIRDEMQLALSIDETYDYCGPHRFLGELMVKTDRYPLFAVGTLRKGLEHLKKATELCPDFGENHLKYAEGLQEDDQLDKALRAAERVLACPPPKGYVTDHDKWMERATSIIEEI
jgi:hypothetical protein